MNPAAPVWVSNAQGSSGGTSPAARSTLDPNTAEFHPRNAIHSKQQNSSVNSLAVSPAQPTSFTKYVGNPIVNQGPSAMGAGAAGPLHHGYYAHHHANPHTGPRGGPVPPGGFPLASRHGGTAFGGGMHPAPSANAPRHHHHGNPSGGSSPYAAAYGGGSHHPSPHFHHHQAHHLSHHSLAGRGGGGPVGSSNGGAGNGVGAQLYSAKANTHWGSAGGPPSNMQQTHHATNGAVLYNQPQRSSGGGRYGQGAAAGEYHSNSNVGGSRPQPAGPSATGGSVSPASKATVLHEDVFFTPSTRGIWSGSAGAADGSFASFLNTESAGGIDAGSASHEPDRGDGSHAQGPTTAASVAVAAVNSLLLDTLTIPSHEDESRDAWVTAVPKLRESDLSASWAKLLTPPPAEARAPSQEDHVDTVQHLLAQLTKNSNTENSPMIDQIQQSPLTHHTTNHSTPQRHADPNPPTGGSVPGTPSTNATKTSHHMQSPSAMLPPSAIGGSPTSPEMLQKVAAASDASANLFQEPIVMKAVPRSMQQHVPTAAPVVPPSKQAVSRPAAPAPAEAAQRATSASGAEKDTASGQASSSAAAVGVGSSTDRRWKCKADVVQLLVNAKETMRHIKILSFSRKYPEEIAKLFQGWAAKGIPAPDDVFGAYYLYVVKKSGVELCMKHNGRGRAPGVGYGRCDFSTRGPNYKCRFQHMCLFCKGEDHGWFDEGKCARFQEFRREMQAAGIHDGDVESLVQAYDTAS